MATPRCDLHPGATVVPNGTDALGERWRCVPPNGDVAHLLPRWLEPREPRAPLRSLARTFGLRHAALTAGVRTARRLTARLDDERLGIEARRGRLGPALRGYAGRSVAANRDHFDDHDWSSGGDEWSESAAWKAGVIEHLLEPTMPPDGAVVEIGAGAGRWTQALAARSRRVVAVDVSARALERCRERLGDADHVEIVVVDRPRLATVADATVDAVWCFDVFVHVAPVDVDAYLGEIARVLRPGGVALTHHAGGGGPSRLGWRAPMSDRLFAALARRHGLEVQRQFRRWDEGRGGLPNPNDVITVLAVPAR